LFAYSLTGVRRVPPSLPHRGRQPKGSIPLTSSFFGVIFSTLSGFIAIGGMPERRGRKHDVQKAPKSDYFFLFRVSTKPGKN